MPKSNEGGRGRAARGVPLPGLRAQRQRKGITQRDLAEIAGVTQGTVWMLEAGHRGAYPRTIKCLSRALEVTHEQLTSGGCTER
jgi:transcriptional regulator with XRE-family HTH domain